MDFLYLLGVARRHWIIMTLGVLIGLALAGNTVYRYDFDRREFVERGYTNYTVETQLVVVDPQFWLGRATTDGQQPDDFNKTVMLAKTYANLLTSDLVRASAEASVGATNAEVTSEGVADAPIIKLTLSGTDREQLERYGTALGSALASYLESEQTRLDLKPEDRMSVRQLASPRATAAQSRRWEMGLLAFLAPVVIAFAIALMIDRSKQLAVQPNWDSEDSVV